MIAFFSGNDSVILKSPELNNIESNQSKVTFSRAMDGTVYNFYTSNEARQIDMAFSNVKRDDAYIFRQFVRLHFSDKIRFITWKNELWEGVLLSNPFEMTCIRASELYSFNVQFYANSIDFVTFF